MEQKEIDWRNGILKELMLSCAERTFFEPTLALTEASLAEIAKADWFDRIDTAYIVGHGTSLATSMCAEPFLSHIAGLTARSLAAFEFRTHTADYLKRPQNTLVIGISCGGGTVSVAKSLEIARSMGAVTVCLSGENIGACAKAAEYHVATDCQVESRGDASHPYSVSHLFLMLAAYKLSVLIGEKKGTLGAADVAYWNTQLDKMFDTLAFVPSLYDTMGEVVADMKKLASKNHIVLGSGPNHGTMFEGALKICEFSWCLGAGEELEDFAHGRFREIDETMPLLIISPKGSACDKTMDLLAGCAVSKTPAIIFTDAATPSMRKLSTRIVEMPAMEDEYLTSFLYVFAFWFYGYHYNADAGVLVGGARYGLYASDINYEAHFDADGNHR